MKNLALLLVLSASFAFGIACKKNVETTEPEQTTVDIDELKPSPVRHDSLSPAQLKDIETIHATFSAVYPVSLNESIKNFKRDQNPDREIQIWMKMVETFNTVKSDGKFPSIEEQQEVFSVILASTMMPVEKIKADVELNLLSESEIEQISTTFMSSFATE